MSTTFALIGPDLKIMIYVKLLPLKKTSFIFTFHKEDLIDFKCMVHQPEMSGFYRAAAGSKVKCSGQETMRSTE